MSIYSLAVLARPNYSIDSISLRWVLQHFPDPALIFAWGFIAAVMIWMSLAAWYDIRTTRIPKQISVTAAILGLVVNVVRGAMMGAEHHKVFIWDEPSSALMGALHGLLFAFLGFVVGFVVFTVIWIFGACGGGDVKLMTAVGAWVGAEGILFVMLVSVVVVAVWAGGKFLLGGQGSLATKPRTPAKPGAKPLPRNRVTFSASGLIATVLVMLFMFRFDLQLQQLFA